MSYPPAYNEYVPTHANPDAATVCNALFWDLAISTDHIDGQGHLCPLPVHHEGPHRCGRRFCRHSTRAS